LKKIALFVFNGDPMCFIHVLLNGLNMHANGREIRIVIEGTATQLIPKLNKPGSPLQPLWEKARQQDIIDGVCKACSNKMGTLEAALEQKLNLLDEMKGHPSMDRYLTEGFEVVTF